MAEMTVQPTSPPLPAGDQSDRRDALRWGVCGIWFIILVMTPYHRYSLFPSAFPRGYGVGALPGFAWVLERLRISSAALLGLRWMGASAAVLAVVGFRRRVTMPVLAIIVLSLDELTKAMAGFANHAQTAPLFVLLILAAAEAWHATPKTESESTMNDVGVVWLVQVVMVLPYLFVGVNRILSGGFGIFSGDAIVDYVSMTSRLQAAYSFSLGQIVAANPAGAISMKLMFGITTLVEITAPILLFSCRSRLTWLMAITVFHIGTLLLMRIFFWENVILLWLAFGPRFSSGRIRQMFRNVRRGTFEWKSQRALSCHKRLSNTPGCGSALN